MSGYRGRTGPNVSSYLTSLNTVLPPYDPSTAAFGDELLDLSQDLSMFTNADFTNTDCASIEDGKFDFEFPNDSSNNVTYEDFLGAAAQPQAVNNNSPTESTQFYSNYNTPIQPAPVPNYHLESAATATATTTPGPVTTQARKKGDTVSSLTAEERSRLAAEEDKRRRNTAASARFRVKKKQREQALESDLKTIQDKSAKLEAKLNQLEMENKWLKELITEKHGIQSKEEMAAAFQKYRKESEERDVKQSPPHTTGVGTD